MNRYYGSDDESEDLLINKKQSEKRKRKIIKKFLNEVKEREKKFKESRLSAKTHTEISSDLESKSNKKGKYDEILDETNNNNIEPIPPAKISDGEENTDSEDSSIKIKPLELSKEANRSKRKKTLKEKGNSIEGYTIIGEESTHKKKQVQRVLPDWLANPITVDVDLHRKEISVEEYKLDETMIKNLKAFNISHFFPIQRAVIPELINANSKRWYSRPNDICVSAPTGSGKTLAFVIPIVLSLKDRVVTAVRCLVVLPVRDLAEQVFKVFRDYCKGTTLNVAKITGSKTFAEEQKVLVREGIRGFHSLADIIVATPGRLIEHLHNTPGFTLSELRFLVIDEADRMMEEIQQGWLNEIEKAVYGEKLQKMNGCCCKQRLYSKVDSFSLTPCVFGHISDPLQKLLYSATISEDSEKIQQLSLFCPRLFTSATDPLLIKNTEDKKYKKVGKQIIDDSTIKYTVPAELKEYFLICDLSIKPLLVWYIVKSKNYHKVLCFAKSVENSHRLYLVLERIGELTVAEYSSVVSTSDRNHSLKQFASGKITILVCSDIMARGMDILDVDCVILYDVPIHLKTYVHRVGRTARAGKEGTAITLMERGEKEILLII